MSDESEIQVDQRSWAMHRGTAGICWLVLFVHAGLLTHVAMRTCVTHDEFWHIPAGLWNVTHGEFHYENLNPPLPRVLAAVPLIVAGAETGDVDEAADKETRADAFVAANRGRYSKLVTLSRLPGILVSVMTGTLIATWALRLFGSGAAIFSTVLWAFSPNVLGHASLVTSDAPAAAATLLAVWSAWKFAHEPSWSKAIWLGVWLGMAQLVKFTCLLLYPMIVVIWICVRLRNSQRKRQTTSAIAFRWMTVIAISVLVINMGYLFRGSFRPLNQYEFSSVAMRSVQQQFPIAGFPVPLPKDYVEGIDHQRTVMQQPHPVYLDAEWSFEGFRSYFLHTWWYKTPHATQLAVAFGLLVFLWPGNRNRVWRDQCCLLTPVLLLGTVASLSHMQLGHRYLLPVLPFVCIFAGQLASAGTRRVGVGQIVAILLSVALAVNLRFHPHHISYFNELAGGPENGRLHLLDSNLDWGQDLFELRDFVQSNDIRDLRLIYFGMIVPADLGIPYTIPTADTLTPGWYAVSVNFVRGGPHTIRHEDGRHDIVDFNTYGWFRLFEPKARIGYSMLVYQFTDADVQRVHEILEIVRQQNGEG